MLYFKDRTTRTTSSFPLRFAVAEMKHVARAVLSAETSNSMLTNQQQQLQKPHRFHSESQVFNLQRKLLKLF